MNCKLLSIFFIIISVIIIDNNSIALRVVIKRLANISVGS